MAAALYQKGDQMMSDSKVLCPVKHSHLIKSGFVHPPQPGNGSPTVTLGYGKSYAVYVHEMTGNVNWTKPGSGSKYLQRAVDAHMRGYKAWIAKQTRANYKRGDFMPIGKHPTQPKA